jgi:hypothetical protein
MPDTIELRHGLFSTSVSHSGGYGDFYLMRYIAM